jgi:hypothetical protein
MQSALRICAKGLVVGDWCQVLILDDLISLFDPLETISSFRSNFSSAAARSDGQGWPQAIAKRLALDGREHSGRLFGSEEAGW